MSDSEGLPDATELNPEEAFGLLGHEIRVGIFLALWKAPNHRLPFEELRAEVGIEDKGQFNYHLSKLIGQFVEHNGEVYELTHAGHRVVDAIQTGVFHESPSIESIDIDSICRNCDSRLVFDYSNQIATVWCTECGDTAIEYTFDPGGLGGRSGEAVVSAFSDHVRRRWSLADDEICPVCWGRTEVSVRHRESDPGAFEHMYERKAIFDDHPAFAIVDCQRCSFFNYVPVSASLTDHPGVVGPLFTAGIDVREEYLWDLPFVVEGDRIAIESDDPWRLAVSVPVGASELRVILDERLQVHEISRDAG